MAIEVVVGCQWGDEGKGKIVHFLAQGAAWVARFQGGANAGHTIWHGSRKLILHLVPSGILLPDVGGAIGNGVVCDPFALCEEIDLLAELGIDWRQRLRISPAAHVVTAVQRAVETLTAQDEAIGTTRRGIGPAYAEKAARTGLRIGDLLDGGALGARLAAQWERADALARGYGRSLVELCGAERSDLEAALREVGERIAPLVCDVSDLLLDADDRGQRVLCEGAQGAGLDIDHGTYPYVTSSNTTVGGACTGLGLPPQRIRRVYGIVKAYATRVGLGPFPSEMEPTFAERFRERAGEYGATTGRPRRCGWYDAVFARRTCRLNGVDQLIVTKLDVLTGIERLELVTGYQWPDASGRDARLEQRLAARSLEQARVETISLASWDEDLRAVREYDRLPQAARGYLERLADATQVPLGWVSVGPGRDQVLLGPGARRDGASR